MRPVKIFLDPLVAKKGQFFSFQGPLSRNLGGQTLVTGTKKCAILPGCLTKKPDLDSAMGRARVWKNRQNRSNPGTYSERWFTLRAPHQLVKSGLRRALVGRSVRVGQAR